MTDEALYEPEPDGDDATGYAPDDLKRIGAQWQKRLAEAETREEKWSKVAERAEAIFACDSSYTVSADDVGASTPQNSPFNILHSSVVTVVPSIYNSSPVPDIRPRHNRNDQQGKEYSDAIERAITSLMDDDRLDPELEGMAQDSYLAGRGVIRVRYEPEMATREDEGGGTFEEIVDERIGYQAVSWRDYREGPATRWEDVPWVAYRHWVSGAEMRRLTDQDMAALQIEKGADPSEAEKEDHEIWEIWDKEAREVVFIAEARVLNIVPDPLSLRGFFPQPPPVQPLCLTGKRTPICPYSAYEPLARELNRATARINKIITGIRVRGIVASDAAGALERWAQADDNEIIASDKLMGAVSGGTIANSIEWWPVMEAIQVIQQLREHRMSIKADIYEIAGISDIVRGNTDARETMGAQKFKVNFANLRVRRLIRQISSASRDLVRMTAEIVATKFDPQTVARLAGVELTQELSVMLQRPFDHFRIDVETDSTTAGDKNAAKQEMGEFLSSTAAFMQVAQGMVQQNPMAAVPLTEMYGAFARHFNLGKQAEDAVDQMKEGARQMATQEAQKAAQGQQDDPAAQELQFKMATFQAEQQAKQAEMQFQAQKHADDMGLRARELQLKEYGAQIDAQKVGLEAQRLGMAERAQQATATAKSIEIQLKQQAQQAQQAMDAAELQLEAMQGRPVGIG